MTYGRGGKPAIRHLCPNSFPLLLARVQMQMVGQATWEVTAGLLSLQVSFQTLHLTKKKRRRAPYPDGPTAPETFGFQCGLSVKLTSGSPAKDAS